MSTLFVDGFYSASASEFETYSQIVGRDDLGNPLETINLSISWDQNLNLSEELGSQAIVVRRFDDGVQFTSGDGNDLLTSTFTDAVIFSGGGDDQLEGILLNSEWNGGEGNDSFTVLSRPGSPIGAIDGGAGYDTLAAVSLSMINVTLTSIEEVHIGGFLKGTTEQLEAIPVIQHPLDQRLRIIVESTGSLDLSDQITSSISTVQFSEKLNLTTGSSDDYIVGPMAGVIRSGEGDDIFEGELDGGVLYGGDGDDIFELDDIDRFDIVRGEVDGGTGFDTLILSGERWWKVPLTEIGRAHV